MNLSHDLVAADTSPLRSAGYAFQFTVATQPGARTFAYLNAISNRTGGRRTADPHLRRAGDRPQSRRLPRSRDRQRGEQRRARHPERRRWHRASTVRSSTPKSIGHESSPNEQADFDNDGETDGCFSAAAGQSVTILLGNGDGTYGSSQTINLTGAPHGIAVLDVDGDGDWDIVDANVDDDELAHDAERRQRRTSARRRFFDAGVERRVRAAIRRHEQRRHHGPGRRRRGTAAQIRTLLGNGDGTFTRPPIQSSGGNTWVMALGDIDGDGDLDATAANSGSANGAALKNNGDGTFAAPVTVSTGAHTPSTDLGDMDGDGDLDWVLSVYGGGKWMMFANDGAGNFTFDQEFTAPSNPVVLDPPRHRQRRRPRHGAHRRDRRRRRAAGERRLRRRRADARRARRRPSRAGRRRSAAKSQIQLQDTRARRQATACSGSGAPGAATDKSEYGNPVERRRLRPLHL